MKKKSIFVFIFFIHINILSYAQSEYFEPDFVSRHMGLSLSQLLNILPTESIIERRDNIYYVYSYPMDNYISLFFIDSQKEVNHWAIFVHAENMTSLYNSLFNSFTKLYGDFVDSELSVLFYNDMPRNVSKLELSKPEADVDNRNALLVRWYGF